MKIKGTIIFFVVLFLAVSLPLCALAQRQSEKITLSDVPEIIREASFSVVMINIRYGDEDDSGAYGVGSGFFILWRGEIYILSAAHLTTEENGEKPTGYQAAWRGDIDGKKSIVFFPIKLVAAQLDDDRGTDFSLFEFSKKKLPFSPAPLEFDDLRNVDRGKWAIAIGAPSGFYPQTTVGNVSYVISEIIVHSAIISRGSSGGPLIGLDGKVIGINIGIIEQSSIGVAINSNAILRFLGEISVSEKEKEKE